jgi:hypothetical protein
MIHRQGTTITRIECIVTPLLGLLQLIDPAADFQQACLVAYLAARPSTEFTYYSLPEVRRGLYGRLLSCV